MKNSVRLFLFSVALVMIAATAGEARWQGPLIAVGIGPFGPLAPYSYPPYSHVYYPSQPLVQLPPASAQQQRPTLPWTAGAVHRSR